MTKDVSKLRQFLHCKIDKIKKSTVQNYPREYHNTLENGFGDDKTKVKKLSMSYQEMMILILFASLNYIEGSQFIEPEFETKYKEVLKKCDFKEKISWGLFLNVENVRMIKICEKFSNLIVFKAYKELLSNSRLNKNTKNEPGNKIKEKNRKVQDFSLKLEDIENNSFLKDALFLYIVRYLELNQYLSRIQTKHLEDILKTVKNEDKEKNIDTNAIDAAIEEMDTYPIVHHPLKPSGYCLIMCVTENRPGAECEIKTLMKTYESCGFEVEVMDNLTKSKIDEKILSIEQTKYCFYDSFIYWILAHGEDRKIILRNDKYIREDLVRGFATPVSFRMKPKIFHFDTCRGEDMIIIDGSGK